ncbi:MAG TPA: beta galactosidase jelly roll domain-containing protein, partial [Bacteroidota bacterium]|nr:beta galactosidase jelly roll domain-containing protein [Bacteroidota bacterium]
MNRSLSTIARSLVLLAIFSSAGVRAQTRILLDDDWKFTFGHAANASKDFNYSIATLFTKAGETDGTAIAPRFNDSTWETVQIPHDWAVRLPFVKSPNSDVMSHGYKPVGGLFPETSIGWYRKKFSIARSDSGKRFQIEFDGVYRNSMIWLNGQFVGNNLSGYIGKKFDVTDIVNFDNPNVLVVRVDATQYEGWFYEGAGIYRHVWLNRYENLHIKRGQVFVHTDGGSASGIVTIETPIENQSSASARGAVRTLIADHQGRIVARSRDEAVAAAVNKTSVALQHVT